MNPFKKPTASQVREQQLADAERSAVEYRAAAEQYAAMAAMYEARVLRLRDEINNS